MDRPLDDTTAPSGPIIIQAHASDSNGVASIAFYVEGELLASVGAGGGRLGEATIEWNPPGPGSYTIQAIATNVNGDEGAPASSVVHINGEPTQPAALKTASTPAVDVTEKPTTVETATGTATQVQPPTQPPQTPTSTVPPPTAAPSATPDTLPPTFSFVAADPDEILTEGPGCASYSRTTIVTAVVSDPGGIANVVANWSVGAESGQVALAFVGSDAYEGLIGPVNTTGTMSITIVAQDPSGNTSQDGPIIVDVQNCIT